MTDEDYMRLAMGEAELGNAPFGCVVADKDNQVVWKDHDRVKELTDPTAHGEINAIRGLCKKLNTLSLEGYKFYTTSEPCATCLSACIKAKVGEIYFGADTQSNATLPIKASELARYSNRAIKIVGGILGKECLEQRERLIKK